MCCDLVVLFLASEFGTTLNWHFFPLGITVSFKVLSWLFFSTVEALWVFPELNYTLSSSFNTPTRLDGEPGLKIDTHFVEGYRRLSLCSSSACISEILCGQYSKPAFLYHKKAAAGGPPSSVSLLLCNHVVGRMMCFEVQNWYRSTDV